MISKYSKAVLLSCLALLLSPLTMRAQDSSKSGTLVITLNKAISMALDQNRDVLIADQERNKADAQIGERYLPPRTKAISSRANALFLSPSAIYTKAPMSLPPP